MFIYSKFLFKDCSLKLNWNCWVDRFARAQWQSYCCVWNSVTVSRDMSESSLHCVPQRAVGWTGESESAAHYTSSIEKQNVNHQQRMTPFLMWINKLHAFHAILQITHEMNRKTPKWSLSMRNILLHTFWLQLPLVTATHRRRFGEGWLGLPFAGSAIKWL
jgi:hypothetical protein